MIIQRILTFIAYKNMSKTQFYKDTGLSNGFLDKVKDIGVSKLERILNTYPEINMEWILLGEGEMIKSTEEDAISEEVLKKNLNYILENLDLIINEKYFTQFLELLQAKKEVLKEQKRIESIFHSWKNNISSTS